MKSDDEILNAILNKPKSNPPSDKSQSYSEPFKQSFGVEVSFYPNGNAWVSETFPLGRPKSFQKVKKGRKPKLIVQKTKITESEEY